ncbi:MAG: AAA family ATPase [Gemmataceae bacterium]|nr:AAA family ATPase [Gemmataceae bacterium]
MSTIIAENELPTDLTIEQAVEAAYSVELGEVADRLARGLPTLIECDKELTPWLYMNIRGRLKTAGWKMAYLDGRPRADEPPVEAAAIGLTGAMIRQLVDNVRGAVEKKVLVLPHLDLLTTSQGGLTSEAREVVVLLYENPEAVWLGFKDPSFPLPKVIENLFPHRTSLLGVARPRLHKLVTQREARKFGRPFNPWSLYKHVSGVNAVRLRRLLGTLDGEDYPADPSKAYRQLRQATLVGGLEVPAVDLEKDIGGYSRVKTRLSREILDVLKIKDTETDADRVKKLEDLLPRGVIFWGPPGTGKTMFAKAMATSIGAAVTVVSGPELKSRWVGESEENLRQIFHRARQSAPAIIVFDEIDSFASARGMYTGSGVEHSMVNQLLTEMDGFRSEELVFVVGTTNFVEALDPALLRPGRFEFHLLVPYPEDADRRTIIEIYNAKMGLMMSEAAIDFAVRRTADFVEGAAAGSRYTGDHLNALCRALARIRLRDGRKDESTPADVERALTEYIEIPQLTPREERVVAVHEAGHAIVALYSPHSPPIERITIRGDSAGALGYVRYQDREHKFVITRNELLDTIAVLMGGREAEQLLLDDLSIGSGEDLKRATQIAHGLIDELGMGRQTGAVRFNADDKSTRRPELSPEQLAALDREVREMLEAGRARAAAILTEHRAELELLRDMLLERKTIEARQLGELLKT